LTGKERFSAAAPKTAREARALPGTEKFAGEDTRRYIGIIAKMCKILFDGDGGRNMLLSR
jgi:hypothetical protein